MKALALDMGGSGGKMFLGTFNGGKIHIVEMHRFMTGTWTGDRASCLGHGPYILRGRRRVSKIGKREIYQLWSRFI